MLARFADLFGPRFSRPRRIANIIAFVVVGGVLLWLYFDSDSQSDRLTVLERSDCKEARVEGGQVSAEQCAATVDYIDRTRPVESGCIQLRRSNYPCPLTDTQREQLLAIINGGNP
jgi:hypothetical protein